MTIIKNPYSLKSGIELSELCSTIIRTLCNGNFIWDMDRLVNFSTYCNLIIHQMNVPPHIIYTSLKYFQLTLINSINEFDIIDLSDGGDEYSLFITTVLLAYKYHEDNPPTNMKFWSCMSSIPLYNLRLIERLVLKKLNYSLSIPNRVFYEWVQQCNNIYDLSLISLDSQQFDLHMTFHKFGYNALLPVLI